MNYPILLISLCEGTQISPAREHYAHKNKVLNMKAANSKLQRGIRLLFATAYAGWDHFAS